MVANEGVAVVVALSEGVVNEGVAVSEGASEDSVFNLARSSCNRGRVRLVVVVFVTTTSSPTSGTFLSSS